jgi:hypothetical protein
MHAQLADFDRELAANQPDVVQDICRGRRMDVMNLLANRASDVRLPRPQYPSTIQVFWLDPMGRQLFKATVLQRGTGRQTVADREYFTEVRDARLWSFDEVTGQPFFTQSLRSITTAELITALSIRSSLSEKCAFDAETKTVVAVVTGVHPTSVERPLLPSGYSFAIIGASGAVLYHSDRRRILKENFFEEFNDPERLQAAVHARTPQRFHTTYARRPTEVFITPFTGIPAAQWFIATLRDEQWLETTNSEALLRTTFWSVAASIPTLAVSLLLLYAGKRSIQHLWPDPGKDSYYKLLVPVYAALLVVGLVGSSFALVGTGLFLLAVLFPLLVILISVAIHLIWVRFPTLDTWVASRAIWHRQHLDGLTHRNWFFIAVAALWACTSVVPAIGLFRYSWTLEIAKFRSLEWNRANQLKESWKAQDDFEWKHVIIEDRSRFLQSRQAYLESYMPQGPVSPVERSWAEQLLDGYLPLYNDVAERLRDQSPGMLAETASSSRRDLLTANVALTWQTLLGAGLTAFIAGWWLRYKDRHLLWARIADARPTRDLTPLAAGCRLAIVAPSERARARLARTFRASTHVAPAHVERSAVPAISIGPSGLTDDVLHRLENIASETYRAQSAATDPATSADVQVDDFEQKVMQPDTRLATLKKLEVCVATKGRAVIICRSDPLHLLNLKSGATGEPQNLRPHLSPLERDRWLAVLESFVVHSAAVEDVDEDEMDSSENHELYFDSLWRYCSQPEKVTLVQVAEEGFANPHQESVVKGLVEKRLMKLEPNLKLKSEAFERFVVRQAGSAQLTAWETPEGALGWRGIRWILAFVVVAVLLFLATTQGAWFRSAAAILTGITVSLEAVSGFIQAINRSRQSLG